MKVLKFGGTSVGTVDSLNHVKKIVEAIPGNAVIIVSALGGVTDNLIAVANLAKNGDKSWLYEFDQLLSRHLAITENVISKDLCPQVKKDILDLSNLLKRNLEGIELLHSLSKEIMDLIVSFGERMSSVIVASMIENGKRHDSLDFIKTEKWFDKNIAERDITDSLIKKEFKKLEPEEKAIVPGFISKDVMSDIITNLGRGGSDYTAALIAAALDAEILEIWTDVDGFMTADPRIVKDSIVIDQLTFSESMELCSFGAKVIYPPTIYPVFHKNIPIKILNTFNSEKPGTLITDSIHKQNMPIKGVSALKGLTCLTLPLLNVEENDLHNRALSALSKKGISIIPVSSAFSENHINFVIAEDDSNKALLILKEEFAPELGSGKLGELNKKNDMSAIALVGEEMKSKTGLAERIIHSLRRIGIIVEASSYGTSDTTFIFIIGSQHTSTALQTIHSIVFG